MKKTFTILIAAIAAILMMAQPMKVWAQAAVNTVLWSEDFSGYSANAKPSGSITNSHTGTTVYGGVTLTYACTTPSGGSTTQVYTSGGPNNNNNLLISKNYGTFSISGISTGDATELTITYAKSGGGTISISSSTTGVTISGSSSGSTVTTNGASTLQLTFTNTKTGDNLRIDDISVKVKTAGAASGTTASPSISGNNPFLTNTTVTITNAASADGADIYYTLNGDAPTTTTSATCFAYTAPFQVSATTTVKAIAKKSTDANASSVVTQDFTKVTPITVSEALTAINDLSNNGTIANQCVSGIVCTAGSLNNGAITYYISADGTATNRLQVYKGKGLYNANFTDATDIAVGDEVVVYGTLKKYVSGNTTTPEFDQGSYLLSKVRKPSPELAWSATSYTATYGESITYPTLSNPHSVTVTYSSSETNVATIDSSTGEITLKANGNTTIKASFAGDATYQAQEVSYTLTVAGMLESPGISFANTEINMTYDEDYEGQALTNPHNLTVTYKSSDEDVAEVDENTGVIALYKAGTVTITANFAGNATYAAGSASYTLTITKAAAGLAFANIGPFNVAPSADFDVPAFSNPHNLTVTWSSTDDDVAIANATTAVIGSKVGTAIITASFDGDDRYNAGEASYTIVVTPIIAVTWDLSTNSYDATPTETLIQWSDTKVTMKNERNDNGNTAVNNYIPTTQNSTRFYKNNKLTITPTSGYAITSVVFTATTSSYATTLKNSSWTNATATASTAVAPYTVTVTPQDAVTAFYATIGGTCGFTSVTVSLLSIPNTSNVLNENVTIPENTTVNLANLEIPADKNYVLTVSGILKVTGTLTNTVPSHLIVKEGGQLIIPAAKADPVKATFQREIEGYTNTKDNYYLIASPVVNDITLTEGSGMLTANYDLYYFTNTTPGVEWRNNKVEHFNKLENSKGYLYANSSDKIIEFPGTVPTATTAGITLNYNSSNTKYAGFNLVGNPLSVNITSMYLNSSACGYYYLSSTGVFTAVTAANVSSNPVIVGQAFMVQASDADHCSLTLNASSVSKGEDVYNDEVIRLEVSNNKYTDVAYLCFGNSMPLTKINHINNEAPMLYIHTESDDQAVAVINERSDVKSVNVNFEAKTMGMYTISGKAERGNFIYMHLYDRLTGIDTDLLESDYTFIGSTNDAAGRFILHFEAIDYNADNESFAYQNGSDIIVNGEGELQIFDVMGRMVSTQQINGVERINVQSQGVYIFRLNEKTQKIVVR